MTDAVRKLIERLAPDPVCDDCIVERLELGELQEVAVVVNLLVGADQFERRRAACTLCGKAKPTTRRLA
jgi:hypothetical protein